eukprot:TRINITY_DN658_c0_g1_i1.p1 TRINITY_DN658_c0_g1~~TRINITY_DN658_c0_g1_i1.p1  ORF type:complete len:182 (-),score=54.45 TRINITY_DN658_c0_g1_i1:372-917(-)
MEPFGSPRIDDEEAGKTSGEEKMQKTKIILTNADASALTRVTNEEGVASDGNAGGKRVEGVTFAILRCTLTTTQSSQNLSTWQRFIQRLIGERAEKFCTFVKIEHLEGVQRTFNFQLADAHSYVVDGFVLQNGSGAPPKLENRKGVSKAVKLSRGTQAGLYFSESKIQTVSDCVKHLSANV